MLGYKAAFAIGALSLGLATPALADGGASPNRSATPASNTASFESKGSGKSWGPSHADFENMRHGEAGHGNGHGYGNGHGNGNGYGHGGGNGHGHGHCDDGDRCHASPG